MCFYDDTDVFSPILCHFFLGLFAFFISIDVLCSRRRPEHMQFISLHLLYNALLCKSKINLNLNMNVAGGLKCLEWLIRRVWNKCSLFNISNLLF